MYVDVANENKLLVAECCQFRYFLLVNCSDRNKRFRSLGLESYCEWWYGPVKSLVIFIWHVGRLVVEKYHVID
jgi:hypothetical protein